MSQGYLQGNYQRIILKTPPASEPITLADAKDFLRIIQGMTLDDALITSLITAARQYCETLCLRTFIQTQWIVQFDCFPFGGGYYTRQIRNQGEGPGWLPASGGIFYLPKPPVMSVDSIYFYDSTNTYTLIDASLYNVSLDFPARVQAAIGKAWPIPAPRIDAVTVNITSGYGPDASSVPECVKTAVRVAVTHLYENRGNADVPMPSLIGDILAPELAGTIL